MAVKMVAGHQFEDTPTGRRCTVFTSSMKARCMRPWIEVRTATRDDIGGPLGFAHVGAMTPREYEEIEAERGEEERRLWDAVVYAASSGSR